MPCVLSSVFPVTWQRRLCFCFLFFKLTSTPPPRPWPNPQKGNVHEVQHQPNTVSSEPNSCLIIISYFLTCCTQPGQLSLSVLESSTEAELGEQTKSGGAYLRYAGPGALLQILGPMKVYHTGPPTQTNLIIFQFF